MKIGEKVRRLRIRRGWTRYRLWKISGVSQSNLKAIEDGKNISANGTTLVKIARALGVTVDDFLSDADASALRDGYHDEPRQAHTIKVPIVAVAVGGLPQEATELVDDEYELQAHLWRPDRKVIKIYGDSMAPLIETDDLLLIDEKRRAPKNGDVVWVEIGAESTVKRFVRERGDVRLVAVNPAFPPRSVTGKDYKVLGTVLGIVWRRL